MTPAQILYFEEVLGVSPSLFATPVVLREEVVTSEVAVLTNALNASEEALLAKIFSSVAFKNFTRVDEFPDAALHRLDFTGDEAPGRKDGPGFVKWNFPKLSEMLGADPSVTEKKKITWALLQQFIKERA